MGHFVWDMRNVVRILLGNGIRNRIRVVVVDRYRYDNGDFCPSPLFFPVRAEFRWAQQGRERSSDGGTEEAARVANREGATATGSREGRRAGGPEGALRGERRTANGENVNGCMGAWRNDDDRGK